MSESKPVPMSNTSVAYVAFLRLHWHRLKLYLGFLRHGGRFRWNGELGAWEARKSLPGFAERGPLGVAVRSMRELRRWIAFFDNPKDPMYRWLGSIGHDGVLWDIGSANGLEGCTAAHLNDCQVVFFEPFTPSIETILKSLYLMERAKGVRPRTEVVQAAIGDKPGFGRFLMHTRPVPGETLNSLGDAVGSYCYGGRDAVSIGSSQWLKYASLDEMLETELPKPTHLKMDIDGLETRALAGAERLLAMPGLRHAVIEANGPTRPEVQAIMTRHGFVQVDDRRHGVSGESETGDLFFERNA